MHKCKPGTRYAPDADTNVSARCAEAGVRCSGGVGILTDAYTFVETSKGPRQPGCYTKHSNIDPHSFVL